MSKGKATFRQSDLARAIRAAKQEGLEVIEILVTADRARIVTAPKEEAKALLPSGKGWEGVV
jgi:hypothetical protein